MDKFDISLTGIGVATVIITIFMIMIILPTMAFAELSYQDTFTEVSRSTSIPVSFSAADGGDTSNEYSGFVKISVKGSGNLVLDVQQDAFYAFTDINGIPIEPKASEYYHELAYNSKHLVAPNGLSHLTPFEFGIVNSIVFDIDKGIAVTPGYRPDYNEDHLYLFVIDTKLVTPSILHFGMADGYFADNSGLLKIAIQQLVLREQVGDDDTNDTDNDNTDDNNTDNGGSKKRNGGCSGDCEPPTLGLDSKYKRIVDNGFTYNGKSINVERFFTPYPLITANIGELNTAVIKIYENDGVHNFKHLALAFGLDSDDFISNSKARIELDINHEHTETVTVYDPENVLDNISVTTNVVDCMINSMAQCLEVTINHMFRESLDFNIVATDVWDQKRNSWQNYFNHGIEVVGESLNPLKEYGGTNRGVVYHLTETSKTTAIDTFGGTWSFKYDVWMMDYIKSERPQDPPTDVMTRTHSEWADYKELQVQKAITQLLEICPTCIVVEDK